MNTKWTAVNLLAVLAVGLGGGVVRAAGNYTNAVLALNPT